jgi:hypothetical protein
MRTAIAVAAAVTAAVLFALSVRAQHAAVAPVGRSARPARRLARAMMSRRWLTGAALGLAAMTLHITALSLAPVPVVQPIGALTLVVVVLTGGHRRAARAGVAAGLLAVCAGVSGFVLIAAAEPAVATPVRLPLLQAGVVTAGLLALLGAAVRGRLRSVVLAASGAVLFGYASALIRGASRALLETGAPWTAGLLALESATVAFGGMLLVQLAYAAGPAAPVVATTTILDPITAVVVSATALGEARFVTALGTLGQVGFAVLGAVGVALLTIWTHDTPADPPFPARPAPAGPGPPAR